MHGLCRCAHANNTHGLQADTGRPLHMMSLPCGRGGVLEVELLHIVAPCATPWAHLKVEKSSKSLMGSSPGMVVVAAFPKVPSGSDSLPTNASADGSGDCERIPSFCLGGG